MTLLGRKPVEIPDSMRPPHQSVVIEARLVSEPPDAAPIDRIYLTEDETLPLLLPPGEFRVTPHGSDDPPILVLVE